MTETAEKKLSPQEIQTGLEQMRNSLLPVINYYLRLKTLDTAKIMSLEDADNACGMLMSMACDLLKMDDSVSVAQRICLQLPTIDSPTGPQLDTRVIQAQPCMELMREMVEMVTFDRLDTTDDKHPANILVALYDAVRKRRDEILEDDNEPPLPEEGPRLN